MASSPMWDNHIMDWITKHYPDRKTRFLDIGAGMGKYGRLLNGRLYECIDAVEIWPAHIKTLTDSGNYNKIFQEDIRDFEFKGYYDIIIMGDILEHMTLEDGQKLVKYLVKHCKLLIVVVPYEMPQHALYDNKFEEHLQPDLTLKNVPERYPELNILFSMYYRFNSFKGIGVFTSLKPDDDEVLIYTN